MTQLIVALNNPNPGADINLIDYDSMKHAIKVFSKFPGPHKISGPSNILETCKIKWAAMFDEEEIIYNVDDVLWGVIEE